MNLSAGASSRWLAAVLSWALLALFAGRGIAAMRVDGTTADEPTHLFYGQRALAAGTFLRENETLNSKMPVSVLNAIPVAVATRHHTLAWPRQLFLARLPSLLLGVLLGCLVWRWAQALFGGWSGTLALFLYTFCPNVLAHSHLVTTDISTALGMFAASFCLWRYQSRPSLLRLIVAGAVFGCAQLTKATALFLLPIFAIVLLIRSLQETARDQRTGNLARAAALRLLAAKAARDGLLLVFFALSAVVVLNLGFCFEGSSTPLRRYAMESASFKSLAAVPVLRDVPLPLPYAYVQGLDMVALDSSADSWSYLRGHYSLTGFRTYFLVAFLVKVPLGTQLLLVMAIGLWLAGRARAPGSEALLVVPVVLLTAYFSLIFRLDIGLRYMLPVFPFLFVFIGRVAAPAPPFPLAAPIVRFTSWQPALTGLLVLWVALTSFSIHPHYLAYFNEIAGGPDQGAHWLIDSNLDWNQDQEHVKAAFTARGDRLPLLVDPSGPLAGRIAIGITQLVGRDPGAADRHAWLRDHFKPVAVIGHSWEVFDVAPGDLEKCCSDLPPAWVLEDLAGDLALDGEGFGGGDDGVVVRFQERLNDGMLGANNFVDAPRTTPPLPRPVRAWFGVRWPAPRVVGRVMAFPGFFSRGPEARKFLAVDYVFQWWDGQSWRDIPGTRVAGNQALRVEHRFAPIRTSSIRLLVERERNDRGKVEVEGGFRAACLELAAYQN